MRERFSVEVPSKKEQGAHEQLPQRFDDPLWQERDRELLETRFGRSVLYQRRAHTLYFGYCEATHPLQRYADEMARSLPPLSGCRVIVTPGDGSMNAGAMPDGTIFVTPKLLTAPKTKEATQGVLMHEWLHIKRAHAELSEKKIVSSHTLPLSGILRATFEGISMGRLHEYSADIQGSILELDKLGINPLGYKEFLEDIARGEKGGSGGMTHGSTHERVLNIAELFTAIHVQSLQAPLHPRDPGVDVWAKQTQGMHVWKALREPIYGRSRAEAREVREARVKEIATIPVCLLPQALDLLWAERNGLYAEKSIKEGHPTPHDGAWMAIEVANARLAQAVFGEAAARRDPLASQMAASCVFSEGALLPEKKWKKVWAYLRADMPYMLFRGAHIPTFFQHVQAARTEEVETRTGLIENSDRHASALADFLVTAIPAIPKTEEEVGHWWSVVHSVVPLLDYRVEVLRSPYAKSRATPAQIAEELFEGWIATCLNVELLVESDAHTRKQFNARPDVIAVKDRLFSHPAAIVPDKISVEQKERAVVVMPDEGTQETMAAPAKAPPSRPEIRPEIRVSRKIEAFFAKTPKALTAVEAGIGKIVEDISTLGSIDQVDRAFYAGSQGIVGSFQRIILLLIVRRVVREHPAFQGYSPLLRELCIYELANDDKETEEVLKILLKNKEHVTSPHSVTGKPILLDDTPLETVEFLYRELHAESKRDVLFERVTRKNGIAILDEGKALGEKVSMFRKPVERMRPVCIGQMLASCSRPEEAVKVLRDCKRAGHYERENAYVGPWMEKFAMAIASGEIERGTLQDQLLLGTLFDDAAARAEYADFIGSLPAFRTLPFKQQLDVLVGKTWQEPSLQAGTETVRWMAQERPLHKEEYEYGSDLLMRRVRELEERGSYGHGVLLLMETFLKPEKQGVMMEFLQAGLTTRTSDVHLRQVILRTLYEEAERKAELLATSFSAEFAELDVDALAETQSKKAYHAFALNQILRTANTTFEELFRMQDAVKHVLLRQILGGKGGLLHTQEGRLKLLSVLRASWLDHAAGDPRVINTLEEVETALAEDGEWEVLYLGIVGLLREHLFQRAPTSTQVEWKDVPQAKKIQTQQHVQFNYESLAVWQKPPKEVQKRHWRNAAQWRKYGEDQCWKALRERRAAVSGPKEIAPEAPHTPMTLVKEIASRATSIGVRTAQNFEQIADLTPEEKQDMAGLFDAVQGQWRVAGLLHLERAFPQLWDVYAEIDEHVGGGTLFTVLRGKTHGGEERALKIVNPNIELHLDRATGLFLRTADRLALRHGGSYALVPGLIRDVDAWVRKELHFKGFVERDREFHEAWNGFAEGSSRYRLRVPRSYGPDIPSLIQEEYVQTTNLTKWDQLLTAGHDMKEVTRLLGVGYFAQLFKGRALSDIHWGNEGITEEDEIVLFDRALLMDTSERDKKLILSLAGQPDAKARGEALEEYFSAEAGVDVLPYEVRKAIYDDVSRDADITAARRLLITLRQHGMSPPLSFMLMMKNTRVLDEMTKKAGWRYGIIEAING